MSTYNICFHGEIRTIQYEFPCNLGLWHGKIPDHTSNLINAFVIFESILQSQVLGSHISPDKTTSQINIFLIYITSTHMKHLCEAMTRRYVLLIRFLFLHIFAQKHILRVPINSNEYPQDMFQRKKKQKNTDFFSVFCFFFLFIWNYDSFIN